MMRILLALACTLVAATAVAQTNETTIRVGRLIDGRGGQQQNVVVHVKDGKITAIDHAHGPVTYDLSKYTLLPGFIDVHVHILWHFGPDGKLAQRDSQEDRLKAGTDNARATVMGGFTTVQSVGEQLDLELRKQLDAQNLPGPRILTSVRQLNEYSGEPRPQRGQGAQRGQNPGGRAERPLATPDQLRAAVQEAKSAGADLIKLFASGSIRDGGKQTMTDEQLKAACSEAKTLGLRSLVHAHSIPSITASVNAGCSEIEHGIFADEATLKLMADRHVYFDPNIGLVLQNYLQNKEHFYGIGNYNDEGFGAMEKAIPVNIAMFKNALKTPGLKIVYGTDAVAGAHGRNIEEGIGRVQLGGMKPMDMIVGMTSLSAESLGMKNEIGTVAQGFDADLVAVDGDPLTDVTSLRKVVFVMRGGKALKKP
jgi:imidazolonepropionase-like amidohydrolase